MNSKRQCGLFGHTASYIKLRYGACANGIPVFFGCRIGIRSRATYALGQGAGKPSTGRFSYTHPFESLTIQTKQKQTPDGVCFYFGCRIGIRTPTNRVRVCRATVTQFGNVLRTDNSIALSGSFVKRILKKIENFLSVSCDRVKKFPPPFTSAHKCGKIFSY